VWDNSGSLCDKSFVSQDVIVLGEERPIPAGVLSRERITRRSFASPADKMCRSFWFDGPQVKEPNKGKDISYEWDFGDGSAVVTKPEVYHTFPRGGEYKVTLKRLDQKTGNYLEPILQRMHVNSAPIAVGTFQTVLKVGEAGEFDGRLSEDAQDDELTYRWDFGDGTTSESVVNTHAYQRPGRYLASLFVWDDSGTSCNVNVVSQYVTVVPQNVPVVFAEGVSLERFTLKRVTDELEDVDFSSNRPDDTKYLVFLDGKPLRLVFAKESREVYSYRDSGSGGLFSPFFVASVSDGGIVKLFPGEKGPSWSRYVSQNYLTQRDADLIRRSLGVLDGSRVDFDNLRFVDPAEFSDCSVQLLKGGGSVIAEGAAVELADRLSVSVRDCPPGAKIFLVREGNTVGRFDTEKEVKADGTVSFKVAWVATADEGIEFGFGTWTATVEFNKNVLARSSFRIDGKSGQEAPRFVVSKG
ncbi:hypothetical protein CMI48_02070, partial [Candidatus Pacearchaeota archaeon]|nr:hypothetical protein [Candidatus Pacearchaeota archaeon]